MFGDLKFPEEEGYDPSIHQKLEANLNEENMKTVVRTIYRKA